MPIVLKGSEVSCFSIYKASSPDHVKIQPIVPPNLNSQISNTKNGGEGTMCTVGGGPDIGNIESLAAKDFECLDCNNKFKAMGRKAMCPSCKSRNVKPA
jgi:hypothetical protein